jgi:hypothetical protein
MTGFPGMLLFFPVRALLLVLPRNTSGSELSPRKPPS